MSRLNQLQQLFESDPADAELPYMIAHEYAKLGEHETAIEWFDRCTAIDPNHLYGYFHKARSLESLNRIDDARDTLQSGLQRAIAASDAKASGEIEGYLSQLGDLD